MHVDVFDGNRDTPYLKAYGVDVMNHVRAVQGMDARIGYSTGSLMYPNQAIAAGDLGGAHESRGCQAT